MAQFLKFTFLIALKLNFNGGLILLKKYQNLVILKIVKFKVESFVHLGYKF